MDSMNGRTVPTGAPVLRNYVEPLWRWRWLLVASVVLSVAASAVYTLRQPPVYRSSATVMVGSALYDLNPSSGEFSLATQLATAYADMAKRSTIRDGTQEALGLTSLPQYSAIRIPNTQLIEINVVDTDPLRAQAVAQELARQLVEMSPAGQTGDDRQGFVENQLIQLESSIVETSAEISRLELELADMFSARQIADTKGEISALRTKLTDLQANYADMLSNSRRGGTNSLIIIEPASLPHQPINRDLPRNIAVAAAVGMVLAGTGIYLLVFLDDGIRSEDDLNRHSGLSALAAVPATPKNGQALITRSANGKGLANIEAYAGLRVRLETLLRSQQVWLLAITSPGIDFERPVLAANLCVEFARAGHRVVLVDGDLRRPAQQRVFGLSTQVGLSTYLLDSSTELESLLRGTQIPGLSVITSGPLPQNPAALLSKREMGSLLDQLRGEADIVVIDTPPISVTVDAAILSSKAGNVLLSCERGRTSGSEVESALRILHQINANLLGVVLTGNVPTTRRRDATYGINFTRARKTSPVADAREFRVNGTKQREHSESSVADPKIGSRNPLLPRM